MLQRLIIRDFVIVDRLELEFTAGFGALTGETGAGKSILVDALALVLGERTDATVIRSGAERAEVSAEFSVTADGHLGIWLRGNDFDDDSCLLRRVVDAGGRSRAYINGTAATVSQLRDVAEHLADIHGQHAHHSLLRTDAQRALLDGHAGVQNLAKQVAAAYGQWRAARQARFDAQSDVEASAREREMLEWQIKELGALAFSQAEWRETEQEQRRLGNAAALIEAVGNALTVINEGDSASLGALQHAQARIADLSGVDPGLADAASLFEGALIQLEEAALALRRYQDKLDLDPARLAELDARIDAVTQLSRKHRIPPEDIPETLTRLSARFDELSLQTDPQALAEREATAAEAYRQLATQLSSKRSKAAGDLSKAVTAGMQELAMGGGVFQIALTTLEEGGSHGAEDVEFLVSANAGQALRSLAKVASGGELSRIGLALQVIASTANTAGTLIFDEVDVGIGGRVAEIVGRMLRQLGQSRQVMCVTHLPQVAAQADWQWLIAKKESKGQTTSSVNVLAPEARVGEIARMLGGEKITETTRKHAAEMLFR